MLWKLDAGWLTLAVVAVSILSFMMALALDAVMGREGSLGPGANATVLTGGFFLSIFVANSYGYNLSDLRMAAAAGVSGAFGSLLICAFTKGFLSRL